MRAQFGDAAGLTVVPADLTDPEAVQAAVDAMDDLMAVVNPVGGYAGGAKVHQTEPKAFEAMLRLNLRWLAPERMARVVRSSPRTPPRSAAPRFRATAAPDDAAQPTACGRPSECG